MTASSAFPGPTELGRGVVIAPGGDVPATLTDAPRHVIDDEVLTDPEPLARVLHHHWVRRTPVVLELAVDNDAFRAPETEDRPVHELATTFGFERERLHALTWANNWDLRSGEPTWWHAVLAQRRLGAQPSQEADVRLPDGTDAWCDGGPRQPLDLPILHRESIALGRPTVSGDAIPKDGLAADQLAAVQHGPAAARVIAPAGSGKTRVLTARLRHLLRDRLVEPELVTAVAYNRRAADEMRSRLPDVTGANIRTIHSLAWWICSLEERREVIEERDVRSILERLVRVGRVPNQDPFQPWLEALSEVRMTLRDPDDVEVERGDVDGLADVFPRFRQELERRRVLDFDEQVFHAIEVLLRRPDIRSTVQQRCTHLLVDEFQDLTPAFLLLLRLAAGPFLQVFGVGDDDQVIYSYAGATPDHLIDFERWFPGATPHALEVNYRCPPPVVEAATTLLTHNRRRIPKQVHAGRDDGGPADVLTVHSVPAPVLATRAVTVVRELVDSGAAPADIAVLSRVNSQLLPLQVALGEAGIPRTGPLDTTVLGRTGIRTALAYLHMAVEPDTIRREHVNDTLNRPSRKLKRAVEPLLRRRARLSLAALGNLRASLEEPYGERFDGYLEDLGGLAQAADAGADTAMLLRLVRDDVGLGSAMGDLDSSRTRPEGSSHTDDLDALAQLAHLEPDPRRFRAWLVESLRLPGQPNGVELSTIHRVKGMEWPHVIVFGANDGLFPHRLADDVEEERRIFHVAITRCRQSVDIIATSDSPSPFLVELTTPASHKEPLPTARVTKPAPRRPAVSTATPDGPASTHVLEALKQWRRERATADGVPPYVILHDKHLEVIASRLPSTLRELAPCPGIGPTKLERYGDEILEVIEAAGGGPSAAG